MNITELLMIMDGLLTAAERVTKLLAEAKSAVTKEDQQLVWARAQALEAKLRSLRAGAE